MEFTPIRISTVIPKKPLTFELYIYFKDQFLKYVDVGKGLDDGQLDKLKKQKIARFYIRDTDESNYQSFLDEILESTISDPNIGMEDKVNFAEGSASSAVEGMKNDPTSKKSYTDSQRAAKTLRKLILDNPDALKSFYGRKVATENDLLIKHCLNVSALTVGLAKRHDISEDDQNTMALAALLHDIGISKMGESEQCLFSKEFKNMSNDEKKIYHQHPTIGAELLKKNPFVNEVLIDLVLSHEEKISGDGYPNKKSKLTLQQEILSLCNAYDKRVTVFSQTPKEALKIVQIDELGNYNLELINTFKKLLKDDGVVT